MQGLFITGVKPHNVSSRLALSYESISSYTSNLLFLCLRNVSNTIIKAFPSLIYLFLYSEKPGTVTKDVTVESGKASNVD
ncbi:MAG: hypothetical protein ACE5GV_17835, partial [Candidatus Scalindua sp.]